MPEFTVQEYDVRKLNSCYLFITSLYQRRRDETRDEYKRQSLEKKVTQSNYSSQNGKNKAFYLLITKYSEYKLPQKCSCAIILLVTFPCLFTLPVANDDTNARSPLEFGDKFQGDIVLTPEQDEIISDTGKGSRTGLLSIRYRWPKSGGHVQVPYVYRASAGFCKIFLFLTLKVG